MSLLHRVPHTEYQVDHEHFDTMLHIFAECVVLDKACKSVALRSVPFEAGLDSFGILAQCSTSSLQNLPRGGLVQGWESECCGVGESLN